MADIQSVWQSIQASGGAQLSLGSAALIVFLVCAVLVFLRGMLRILIGSAVIAASIYAALWAVREAPAIGIRYTGEPRTWISTALPIVVGLLVFLILRFLIRFVVKPGAEKPTLGSRFAGLFLALIPAALLCLAGALLVHHFGSVAELRTYAEKSTGEGQSKVASFTRDLKKSLEKAIPSAWLAFLDPATDHARLTLAKLIARQENTSSKAEPPKEEPILRAIVVDEKELRALAREKRYGTLLQHPKIDKALADPKVQKALDRADL
jgi:uncharacterized membrane protein required for colicin V production